MIEYLLFDIDNTLYPASCGLGEEMNRRMTRFVSMHLEIDLASADSLRARARRQYGTTLKWLQAEHGLDDVDPYMEAVHPADLSRWITDDHAATAREALEEIDLPASVLTNGPAEHAGRVLDRLGLTGRFERVFDLRSNNYVGKPSREVYLHAARELDLRFASTLFVDDVVQYLLPFRDLGGMIVHMSTPGSEAPSIPRISNLRELASIIYPRESRR